MGTINDGNDRNFYKEVSVSAGSFSSTEDVLINIKGQRGLRLENYGSGAVEYSFNGNVVHGYLAAGSATDPEVKHFDCRVVSKVWLRSVGGTNIVRVEAWAGV